MAAITNVDLDHMDRLGPTVRHIAREKAAIIERGDLAVTGATGDALAIVRRRARRLGVPLREVAPAELVGWNREGIEVELPRLGRTRVGLLGRHQAANVAVADAVLDALEEAGLATVPAAARRAGYAAARWPGRLELVSVDGRDVLLDGAHNPAGAAALGRALDDLRPLLTGGEASPARRPPVTLLTATMADKDVAGIALALGGAAALEDAHIICTSLDLPRAMSAADLAAVWSAVPVPGRSDGRRRAGRRGGARASPRRTSGETDGPVVVAGSLYLVGEVRRRLVADPLLEDPREVGAG